ncbi:MAG: family 10 glycosylhydrolase [Ignavibacteria bacterium]|nr:family 10 glycosylhydrolase [Ignavibacteria bacterium]
MVTLFTDTKITINKTPMLTKNFSKIIPLKIFKVLVVLISLLFQSCFSQSFGVRGVWLTNVDSDVLTSKEKIVEAVKFLDELNFNTIIVVVWNKGMTQYKSKIMKEFTGLEIDTMLKGFDPLPVLIEEAHKRNMKVIAWFEFGFSSSYKLDGGEILRLKPHWKAIDYEGKLVSKNGFEWMNGFHPEVQEFILSLIKEVVTNYNIDGIQGDDRLPAMPVESGYDEYTINLYRSEHNGQTPPKNFRDSLWIEWRAKKLNAFAERIFNEVKSINPNLIVSMAPSIYPWSKEEYLQDWPTWVNSGKVDLVCPQLYRYKIEDYEKLLDDIVNHQIEKTKLSKFYPGILLKIGSYYASPELLKKKIELNRKYGINGEVYFFYEGLKKTPELFKEIYKDRVQFPDLVN